MQAGADLATAGGFRFGLTAGYVNSNTSLDSGSDIDATSWNLGGYAGYSSGGFFANALIKYASYDGEYKSATFEQDLEGRSLGGMVELGYRFGAPARTFFEPSASLAYVDTNIDSVTVMGTRVRFDDDKSLRGKLGARVGVPFAAGGGNAGLFYAGGNWTHEFEGDGHVELGDDSAFGLRVRRPRDYAEVNAGISIEGKGAMSGFFEGTAKFGKDDYSAIGIRGGLRLNF